jgi:hypothetical protein
LTPLSVAASNGTSAMVLQRFNSAPDSDEDNFPGTITHHQPFKQEASEGIENTYT